MSVKYRLSYSIEECDVDDDGSIECATSVDAYNSVEISMLDALGYAEDCIGAVLSSF